MILDHTKLLLTLYHRPLDAMSGILDQGSWVYAGVAVVATSLVIQFAMGAQVYSEMAALNQRHSALQQASPSEGSPVLPQSGELQEEEGDEEPATPTFTTGFPFAPLVALTAAWLSYFSPSFTTVFSLALLYVPLLVLAMSVLEPIGSFGVALRRDYGGLLACTLMAWTAAHLPFAVAGLALMKLHIGLIGIIIQWAAGTLAFGTFMVFALRTVFGASYGRSIAVVCVSPISVVFEIVMMASGAVWLIASPFVLFMLYSFFRGSIGDLGASFRHRQSFRRNLEVCTINPRDAEAHYQLGLIYQQRRQYTEAIARFRQAVEIDPNELDAHFQLGRIAREQGRPQEALDHFGQVISRDEKHSLSEVWREIGGTYQAVSMWEDARSALERFIERRPFDAEGLYRMANVASKLNQPEQSREMLERCIEAVKTMPYYRRGDVRKWGKLAEKDLGSRI
jgi:hypothetical protein